MESKLIKQPKLQLSFLQALSRYSWPSHSSQAGLSTMDQGDCTKDTLGSWDVSKQGGDGHEKTQQG